MCVAKIDEFFLYNDIFPLLVLSESNLQCFYFAKYVFSILRLMSFVYIEFFFCFGVES